MYQVPRNNFDTLLWSVVTVFQVITGENWNNIMYDTIRGNGMFACVYFISLVRVLSSCNLTNRSALKYQFILCTQFVINR